MFKKTIEQVIEDSIKGVVSIFVLREKTDLEENKEFLLIDEKEYIKLGNSSAFFVSKDGLIVSNYHSLISKDLIYKIHWENNFYDANIKYIDEQNDIILLKIQNKNKNFPYIKLGDSSKLKLGNQVIAIGDVLDDFEKTVSTGIISGLSRYIKMETILQGSLEYKGLIQTDAAINPGNSGGPLINEKGYVIGVNTLSVQGAENIGLAIPINYIKKILHDLKKFGKVENISLGVKYVLIDNEVAQKRKLPIQCGAFVVYGSNDSPNFGVQKGSLAEKQGIIEGDIILSIDNQKIESTCNINDILKTYNKGNTILVKVLRNNKEISFKFKLE